MTLGARCLASRFSVPAPMMSSSSSSERPSLTAATRQSTASETPRRHAPSRGVLIRRGSSAPSVTMTPPIQGCPALWQADAARATTSRASEPSCAFPAASMPMGVPGRIASLAAVLSGRIVSFAAVLSGRVASLADALPSCSAAHNVATASGAPVVQYAAQITTSQPAISPASKVAGKRWPASRRTRTNRGSTTTVPFCRADIRVYAASASAKSSSNSAAGLGLGFGSSPECCGPLPSPPRRDPQSWSRRRGSMPSPSSISPTRSPAASRAPFAAAVTIRPPPAR